MNERGTRIETKLYFILFCFKGRGVSILFPLFYNDSVKYIKLLFSATIKPYTHAHVPPVIGAAWKFILRTFFRGNARSCFISFAEHVTFYCFVFLFLLHPRRPFRNYNNKCASALHIHNILLLLLVYCLYASSL